MSSSKPPKPYPVFMVTSSGAIRKLAAEISLFGSRKRKIRVELASLSAAENEALEATIARHYSACGCGQGRLSGVITLVGYLALVFTGVISVRTLGVGKTILLYFACAAAALVVGKSFALWNARRSLIALSKQIEDESRAAFGGVGG